MKSASDRISPSGGMIMSFTSELAIELKALPMMMPTAISMTLPRTANSLNSLMMRLPEERAFLTMVRPRGMVHRYPLARRLF